jgi:hypothetical protein
MSNPVSDAVGAAANAPAAVAGWAKARPVVFIVLVVVVALLAIKFSDKIVGFLARSKLTAWMVPKVVAAGAGAAVLLAALSAGIGA